MSYDYSTNILSGASVPQLYHPNASLGQVIIHYLLRDASRIIQTNFDDGIELSAGKMAKLGSTAAANLLTLIKVGDVIGFVVSNTTFVSPLILGCFIAGNSVSPCDPTYDSKEIAHIFKQTKPKLVFCDRGNYSEVLKALSSCGIDCEIWTVDEIVEGVRFINELFESKNGEMTSSQHLHTNSSDLCALILFSSGTTGLSKGVMLSHAQCIDMLKGGPAFAILLSFSSLYWFSGFSGLMQSFGNNVNRIITRKAFSPELLINLVECYKIHALVLASNEIMQLLASPGLETADFRSVTVILAIGGPLALEHRKSLQSFLKTGTVMVTYAITECGGIVSRTTPFAPQSSSCGRVAANTKLKIVDEEGKTLSLNQTGEVIFSPPHKFLGYIDNLDESKIIHESKGWLRSGDLGYISDAGEVFILDRKKEVFDYMNYQVSPAELEAWIGRMKGVKAVCVVGIPDQVAWSLGAALVVKAEDSNITEQEIVNEIKENFLQFKWLHGGAYFVDRLPMTSSGKIKRFEARAKAENLYKLWKG